MLQLVETTLLYIRSIPVWLVLLMTLLFIYYKYNTYYFGLFKQLGVPGPKPWPVIGTMLTMLKHGIMKHDLMMKEKYGDVVGLFQGRQPIIMISDVEVLKHVLIKDFANFTNRFVPEIKDYPMEQFITMIKDDQWKHVRNVVSPTFSSGKLRKMNQKMLESAETFVNNLAEMCRQDQSFDFRDLCGAFTMDVIASTAFSLKIDSYSDPNNRFVQMGKKTFKVTFENPKIFILFFFPFLMKPLSYLNVSLFPKDALAFFLDVIKRAMKDRTDEDKKSETDFLQLLLNAKMDDETEQKLKGSTENWTREGLTMDEVLAQSLIFFLAGYETVANTMSLMGYCLATNPECQEKLIQEIDEVMANEKCPTYDVLKKMPYLDMCFNETQRLYPAAPRIDRVCKSDCNINGLFIPKDITVGIPIYVLHMDPNVWPEPEKFKPDRFLPEEKEARNPYYYMPFGQGPRNCVGMRLAIMEIKMAMVCVLQKFKFVTCSETEIPLIINKVTTKAEHGVILKVERRSK